jgi:hypothetical protein
MLDISENLQRVREVLEHGKIKLTLALKAIISSSVMVSALAITGIKLTLV